MDMRTSRPPAATRDGATRTAYRARRPVPYRILARRALAARHAARERAAQRLPNGLGGTVRRYA
jgi:hypothetical protein